ncbi:MAG: glutamine--fructose-6-phosphate transaminase (isomerizing) [Gemmatimonadetes bacterium]|nr:glutamine--fructose-6-phosphate transaminase (isomerizing) [Gemmatimonadota bacterium]
MCGIIGFIGARPAQPVLIDGLQRMEYRGYDSAGVAIQNGRGLRVRKRRGRVRELADHLSANPIDGHMGIAHTRWATHGPPTSGNAHPHLDCTGEIAVVHNGIIENADTLRTLLRDRGHTFLTPTDTEVLAHLIEDAEGETLEEQVRAALRLVEGAYGIAVMSGEFRDRIVVARQGSPVLLGLGEGETFVASDPAAVVEHTRSVIYLEDGDIAVLSPEGYRVLDREGNDPGRPTDSIHWDVEAIELGGYAHFMQKEIFEQPESLCNTLRGRLVFDEGDAHLGGLRLTSGEIGHLRRVLILGCGTSWHSGMVGRHFIEALAQLPVEVEYASEFRYHAPLSLKDCLVVAISQSGETADTLAAMKAARERGGRVVGIVNAVGSTIAREAHGGIYLHAGPEVGVASTKAFTSQLAALLMLGLHLGRRRGLSVEDGREVVAALSRIPALLKRTLRLDDEMARLALLFAEADNALYLGRGVSFPVALEGALKLKEVSYAHAEGYPAAELKHGPIALIDDDMPVVVVAPSDQIFSKVVSNVQEVRARGGRILVVTTEGNRDLATVADHEVLVPETHELLTPLLTVIPLQLLAYHIAVLRGCDVDRPRNLAKSVTVE